MSMLINKRVCGANKRSLPYDWYNHQSVSLSVLYSWYDDHYDWYNRHSLSVLYSRYDDQDMMTGLTSGVFDALEGLRLIVTRR